MEVARPLRFTSMTTMEHFLSSPTSQTPNHQLPFFSRPILSPKITFSAPRRIKLLTVTAKKKPAIEGVSQGLNLIASQNLDQAPARRRVRLAFTEVQQQLDHCLFKLAPSGIRTKEWYERNSRGLEIFCKKWIPEQGVPVKGALFFCHGYGDTCTFFFEGIARHIAAAGYAVYALDHPGFGLSEGLHGYIHSFDELADNVTEIYRKIKQDMKPPPPVLKILTLMSRVLPKAKLIPQKDLAELAFREERKREMAVYNVICYSDQTRLRTAVELLDATSEIERRLEEVSSPLLILHGAKDRVTDPQVSQFLYEKASSKDKTLKLYEEGYHCILEGEPDERILTVLNDIITWLDFRSSYKQN
ncbi:caffeoylshikimate esterase isoform X2 [Humulus lupulus]|uniref:caffeoylshikimate esterase isoform X2 n=1 Tax=Humulus lupulus TaxID=3486 RepID=UPI002B40E8A9|nr:caffeoylshikimate esterase isoform X2 [Humulus lupulus]